MVWMNYVHSNVKAPYGTFGGSICMCDACKKKREPIPEKTVIEIMQEAQLGSEDKDEIVTGSESFCSLNEAAVERLSKISSIPLDPDFAKIVNDHLWELI